MIWGTGNTSNLLQEGLKRIERRVHVVAYTDSRSEKWVRMWNGHNVISPEDAAKINDCIVLISAARSGALKEIRNRCCELNMRAYMPVDEYIFKLYSEEVLKCYDQFIDDESKLTYYELIEARTMGLSAPKHILKKEKQFFCVAEFMASIRNGAFIDCGAFTGDTIEEFIWEMGGIPRKIIAFEPDKKNYESLKKE